MNHDLPGKYVRHLEIVIIFAIMVMVLVYTVKVDRNFPYSNTYSNNKNIPISKQETPALKPIVKKEESFFPEMDLNPDDEGIIEETFTEVP